MEMWPAGIRKAWNLSQETSKAEAKKPWFQETVEIQDMVTTLILQRVSNLSCVTVPIADKQA